MTNLEIADAILEEYLIANLEEASPMVSKGAANVLPARNTEGWYPSRWAKHIFYL